MVRIRVLLGRCKPFPLYSLYMKKNGLIQFLGILQNPGQFMKIVPIHRTKIPESHIFKHTAVEQTLADGLFQPMGQIIYPLSHRSRIHELTVFSLEGEILRLCALLGQILRHASNIWGDGHAVVIQNNKDLLFTLTRVA